MPVDPTQMRKIIDHNDDVTTGVRTMTDKLHSLDPRSYGETNDSVRNWAKNVHELKGSLENQQSLSKAMRESARIDDEQHGESFRDKFQYLIDRLKADIRFFYAGMEKFIDLPQDFTRQKTWDHYVHDMEMSMKKVVTASQAAGDNMLVCLDTIVILLNFRDAIISCMLNALLFQKAVLDWDLKSNRTYADRPMVDMSELVVNLFSKNETVPDKLICEVPLMNEAGVFTYDKRRSEEDGITSELSPLQARLLTVLREMQSLDKGLRNMKFGQQVNIPDKHRHTGKNVAADELRGEVTKWFNKCHTLEQELQAHKAQRHTPWELQVEQLTQQNREKDSANKQLKTQMHKVEGELQSLRNELQTTRRERTELAEKNARMQKENVPRLDQMDKLLEKSHKAVNVLTADAVLLSNMFREQVKDNRNNIEKHDDISKELTKVQRQLKNERLKNQFKEDELQKKETLYLRTMAARKSIHESYLEQKTQITEVEEKMRAREADWQEMLKVVQGRDSEIKHLKEDLRRANQRIDELEQQKKMCMKEFKRITGQPCNMLLEQFKAEPTCPPSAVDGFS